MRLYWTLLIARWRMMIRLMVKSKHLRKPNEASTLSRLREILILREVAQMGQWTSLICSSIQIIMGNRTVSNKLSTPLDRYLISSRVIRTRIRAETRVVTRAIMAKVSQWAWVRSMIKTNGSKAQVVKGQREGQMSSKTSSTKSRWSSRAVSFIKWFRTSTTTPTRFLQTGIKACTEHGTSSLTRFSILKTFWHSFCLF